jgi:hypothetical protein
MSQPRLSNLGSAYFAERGGFGGRLALLAAPLAGLLYPFLLEGFHANVAPVIGGQTGQPVLRVAAAALCLLLAFAVPIVALLAAMSLGEINQPTVAQRRAGAVALLAVATPPLFVFLGVELYMLHDRVPDIWLWSAFWMAMTAVAALSSGGTIAPAATRPAPARLRVAHGLSALCIVVIFLAMHLVNHATFILGPDTYRAVMKVVRHVYRQGVLQPLLVVLLLFQVGSGVYLATRANSGPVNRFRTFQIASGIFLAAYILGHMNSVFIFARLYLGIDSGWGFATGAPTGLIKDAWNIRLVPHYALGVFFVLSHLAAGGRAVMLSHGVAPRHADRFLIGGATAAGVLAFVILFGMCGARLSFILPGASG